MSNNLKNHRFQILKEIYISKRGEKFLKQKFGEDKYKSIVEEFLELNNYIEHEKIDADISEYGQQIIKEVLSWKCTEKGIQYYEEDARYKKNLVIDILVKIGILILGIFLGKFF